MKNCSPTASTVRLSLFVLLSVVTLAPVVHAAAPPYWNGGTGPAVTYTPAPWPSEAQWVAYTNANSSINDQRTQDPSNGGTSPQAYVNVSSGCDDQDLPSVYYFYDAGSQVIFYRWRVENGPNNYGTGPSPGSFGSTNPWNSAQWTVMFDLNGDGFRDFAAHLNGSTGSPSAPIDVLNAIWSPTLSNTLDYENDPNVHVVGSQYTAFIGTNNQILQFDGDGAPTSVQWPNGSSETVWDYGTTRATDISTTSCREYYVDYQIPLAMLDATAVGGPALTPDTPFSFMFATANSLNNPFQKDIVLDGVYVCPPTSPAPFGDPMTLNSGIIEQAIATSITSGSGSCSAVPLKAQILDSIQVTNCQTISTLVDAQFKYYYDANGNGEADDGGTWTDIIPTTMTGTTVTASWDTSTLIRGQYLVALEMEDGFGHTTRTWIEQADAVPGSIYTNFPNDGLGNTAGVNYTKVVVGPPCGAPPPTMTKSASPAQVQGNGSTTYTLTITNTSSTTITVSQISDTLPPGFTYQSVAGGTLGVPSSSPAVGASGTISFGFPGGTTVPGSSSRTFLINVNAGTSNGSFYNTASAITSVGTITGADSTGVSVRTATLNLGKTASSTRVQRGDTVTFTMTYSNNSETNVTGAVLTDILPAGFLYQSASPAPTSAPAVGANGTVTWTIGAIAANTGPFTRTITATASVAGSFTNTATLTSNEAPTVNASANVFVSGPVLAISKTATAGSVAAPATVDYTITFANVGDGTANVTTMTDVVPTGFTLVAGAPTSAGCTQAGTTITCTVSAPLTAGASLTRTLRFTVSTAAPSPSVNTATVNASNALSASTTYSLLVTNNTCTDTTYYFHAGQVANTTAPVSGVPQVTSTFVIGSAYTEIARFFTPVISATDATAVTNTSLTPIAGLYMDKDGAPQIAGRVLLYDYNPVGPTSTLIGSGLTGGVTGNKTNALDTVTTFTITAGTVLPAGHQLLWVVEYRSDHASQTNNVALRYDGTGSPSGARVCLSTIRPSISKSANRLTAIPGTDSITYTIRYANPSAGNIPNAVITDILPAGLTYTSSSLPPTTAPAVGTNGTLTWNLGTLAGGASGTITVVVGTTTGMSASLVTNTATLTNDVTAALNASATTYLIRPIVGIAKRASITAVVPGQSFSYTIDVVNSGNATATGVVMTDTLPSYISSTNYTGATNTVAAVNVTSGGAGYVTAPTVSFAGGGGTGAAGTAILSGGSVVAVMMTNGGTGYTSAPSVSFSSGAAAATSQLAAVSVAGQNVTFNVGTLAAGATASFTIAVQVQTAGIPAGDTPLTNSASVVDNYNTTPRVATAIVNLTANPVLTLVETATPSDRRVVYVNVTAGGTWTTIPTVSFTGGGCSGATGTVSVTGTPGNYTITGVTITNAGTGCTSAPSVVFSGSGAGGATAAATIGPGPGDTITYLLTATNTGNADATGVTIFDVIPNYTNWTSGGTFSINTVTSSPVTVAPGASTQLTYTVTVGSSLPAGVTPLTTNGGATSTNAAPPAPVTTTVNTGAAPAYAIAKGPDDTLEPWPVATLSANASASTTVTVTSTRLIDIGTYVAIGNTVAKVTDKTATQIVLNTEVTAPSGTNVLQAIEFTIVYENTGNAAGTNVIVYDNLPPGMVYGGIPNNIPPSPTPEDDYPEPTFAPAIGANGTVQWNIGPLTNGGTGILKYVAWATTAGTYTNTVRIEDGTTLNTYNASDSATNTFGALDPWKVTTTPSIINQAPTNVAHYVITVGNPLATPATNVAVIDKLSAGFTYQPGSTTINGSPAADPAGLYVAGISLTNGGSGYTTAPTISFSGGGGSGAAAKAVLTAGVVTNIVITNPGFGYTSAPTVIFSSGAAAATASVSDPVSSPQWSGLTIPAGGTLTIEFDADIDANVPAGLYQNEIAVNGSIPSLYFDFLGTTDEDVQVCVPPPIVSAPPACGGSSGNVASILAQPASVVVWAITNGNGTITTPTTGTVHQVAIGYGGSGYAIAPGISFTGGGGSGAAAIATVTGGVITAITVTNPGSGYTSLPMVVVTPNGSGADAFAQAVLGTGIVYDAGAMGTVDLAVTVTREFSNDTDACEVTSLETVTIVGPPTITSHPQNDTVCAGTLASFSVVADEATAYQWQVSTNGGGLWTDITGATATTYAFNAVLGDNGKLFRVIVTRGPGCLITSNSALLTVSCTPDLEVTVNDDTPDPVVAGENITYTQRVTNIGPVAATAPVFSQNTPAGTTFVSMTPPAGWSCITPAPGGTGAITCTADANTLAANATSGNFTLVLATSPSLADGSTVTEVATVTMQEVDPSPANNTKSAETLVSRVVDVMVVKDNDAFILPYGDGFLYTGNPPAATPLTYTIVVTNNGPSLGTNITVTDTLPAQFDYDHTTNPATSTQGTCGYNAGTRTVTCTVGSLTNDAIATITIPGTVAVDSVQFTNVCNVTTTEVESDYDNNESSSMVSVLAPTEVELFSLDATQSKSGVTVRWQTSFEADNLGFNVYRSTGSGAPEKINNHIITGSTLFTARRLEDGRNYRYKDTKVPAGLAQYWVEDIDLRGTKTMHGPVTPKLGNDDDSSSGGTDPDPGLGSVGGILESPRGIGVLPLTMKAAPATDRLNQQWKIAAQKAAKVVVTTAGWVSVKKRDLVAAGYDPGTNSRALAVFTDGQEIAVDVRDGGDGKFDADDTVEFFGTGIDTATSGGRVYFIVNDKGRGARLRQQNGPKKGTAAPASFNYSYWRKERTVFFSGLVNNGDNDNFFGAIVTSWPVSEPLAVENLATTSGGNAQLELVMQGGSDRMEHVVSVTLNGHAAGTIRFRDLTRYVTTLSIPTSWLVNGANALEFTAENGWEDVSVVEAVRLTYPHLYRADGGALAFTVNGGTEVPVAGFAATDVVAAVDLTNPEDPVRLNVTFSNGTATVIAPDTGVRTIFVYAANRIAAPAQVVLNAPSTWNDNKNAADLVILTHSSLTVAAKTLKAARDAQGIATTIVDVQNVYDEFAFGHRGPQPIRDFLKRTQGWKRAPRYAILLGDSSFDPRNYYGIGNVDYVPTKLVPTGYIKTASDDWFADFDDDGIASLAIGRIPVRTLADANGVVTKLTATRTTNSTVTLVSDYTSGGMSFEQGSAHVAQQVPSSLTTSHIKAASTPNAANAILGAFNNGSLIVNYTGHGSVEIWSNLFSSYSATSLTNGTKLPFVVAMNCLNGYFHDLYTDSLGEALLRNPNGGAVSVWASSALTAPHLQTQMNAELYRHVFTMPIGDAIIKAKQSVNDLDVRRTFILFGDPTLRLR
ncbi:MAG TPA: C25 family cysteine peptidase [Thermoanaerobaculia bacterium]|nr:C25 family cysteine peptidase [Thermoanaerobaculia bacterium]